MRTPIIVTASWRDVLDPANFIRVGVSRMPPRHLRCYRTYPQLQPGPWWRAIKDPAEWSRRYRSDVLDQLDADQVAADLAAMALDGRMIALCCWETFDPPSGWCHRGQISGWLSERLDLHVAELGDPENRCGALHPMLAAQQ